MNYPESLEQQLIVNWIRQKTTLPVIKIDNEGKRTRYMGALAKRQGLCPGASDLFIPRATKDYHGLWIEVKSEKGRLSPAQIKFATDMINEGYQAVTVWNSEAAIEIIKSHYQLENH